MVDALLEQAEEGVDHGFTLFDLADRLRAYGWQVPAYTLPENRTDLAIQRILVGEQYMTVYKAIKPEAEAAADLAYALLQGKQPDTSKVNGKVANEGRGSNLTRGKILFQSEGAEVFFRNMELRPLEKR